MLLAAALMMVASGCKKEAKPGQLQSISFKQSSYSIAENYLDLNLRKELQTVPEGVSDTAKITFVVSDDDIAYMDGVYLTPKRDGEITVTATIQGKSATCGVEITAVPIEDFELEDFSVAVGGTEKALLNTTPSGISPSRFTWSVADHSIATIDQNGVATGIKDGETTVTAAVGDKVRTGKLTVKKTIVTNITLSQTEARFYKVGETLQLTATVKPDDASYPEVTWSSSDASVVSVDNNGNLTAKKYPSKNEPVTITAKADNVKATCKVTLWPQQASKITLSETAHTFSKVGDEFTLSITAIQPEERTLEDKFKWYTDDFTFISINGDHSFVEGNIKSVNVKCKEFGTTKIHCLDMWSGVEAVCEVSVLEIPATDIKFKTNVLYIPGSSPVVEFEANLTPANSTSSVYWESTNPLVVNPVIIRKSNEYGNKTTIVQMETDQIGTTVITATVNGKTAYCYVSYNNKSTVSDGTNTYKTVKIGSQWWMAENLRSTKYASQSERANVPLEKKSEEESIYYYNPYCIDKESEYLYNWAAAVGLTGEDAKKSQSLSNRQGICPNGWHLPTKSEWSTLTTELYKGHELYEIGTQIKSQSGWNTSNGKDVYGFNAYPAGGSGDGECVGCCAVFWSASWCSNSYPEQATVHKLYDSSDYIDSMYDRCVAKSALASVRCVKN